MMEVKSEYKMSELGEIPIEWEINQLKDILTVMYGKNQKKVEVDISDIPILGTGGIIGWAKEPLFNKKSVLIGRKGTIDKPIYIEKPFWTIDTLFYTDINTDKSDIKFVYYLFQTIDWYKHNEASGVPSLSAKNISNIFFRHPTLKEQKKIAEILSTVDEQIAQTNQLIEKTKELKKGLMLLLLTKGIGHTEFKQSKLGEIPVEWDIALFEDIMLSKGEGIRRGPFGGALKKEIFVEEGFAIYEQQHAIHKDINKFRYFITPEKYDEMAAFNVKAGDILMSCSGTIGRVLLVPEDAPEGIINQALLRLRPKSYINLQFLKYLLQSEFVQNNILDRAHGSALKNMVAVSELKKIKLRIPQEEEQKKIAEILYSVDEEIEGYQEEKAKYEELKKGLMQQLLTGKRRVKV